MPTPTYDKIATQTVSGFATNITFSSIPGTYRDLILVCQGITDTTTQAWIRFNNNSSNIYNFTNASAIAGGTYSAFALATQFRFANRVEFSASERVIAIIQILDYAQTDKHKVVLSRTSRNDGSELQTSRYESTSAISSILIDQEASSTFSDGSVFTLYGLVS
jgi:hypothetical protein